MTAVREGDLLWTPGPDRVAQANLTAFTAWLAAERGLRFDGYAGLWRLVSDRPGRVLAGGLGLLRHRGVGPAGPGPGPPGHAGSRLVPRRPAELRPARAAARGPRRARAAVRQRVRAARGHGLGRAGRLGAGARHPAAGAGRPAGRPGRRLPAEHPAGGDRDAGHRQHRRDLDQLLAGLRLAGRAGPVPAARARRAVLLRQLRLRRPGVRPQRRAAPDHRRAARAAARGQRAAARPAGQARTAPGPGTSCSITRRSRPRSTGSSRSRSATRCGSCSPPAPPGCPRRSCTATAGSCWSS